MGSLASITYQIRTVGKFAGIIISCVLILFLGFKGIILMKNILYPTPPAPPNMCFGPHLAGINFPSQTTGAINYTIDTDTGYLPTFPDRIKVYKTQPLAPQLSALQNARTTVNKAGFTFNETQTDSSGNIFSWQDSSGDIITYNILTHNFAIIPNPTVQIATPSALPSSPQTLESAATTYVQGMNIDTTQLQTPDDSIEYFQNSGAALIPTDSAINATVARVNFFYNPLPVTPFQVAGVTNPISTLPVVFPGSDPDNGSIMSVTLYPAAYDLTVLSAKFNFQPIDLSTTCDYPLITAQQAYENLQKGDAYIINPTNSSSVDITSVELAYYVGENPQEYVYPVVVFKGKNFTAYVSALPSSVVAQ